ncbi:hypothetical protein [Streptomyces sp. TE5632]
MTQMLGRGGRTFTPEEADVILETPAGQQVLQMLQYTTVGNSAEVKDYLDRFTELAQADELVIVSSAIDRGAWLRSLELPAEISGQASA